MIPESGHADVRTAQCLVAQYAPPHLPRGAGASDVARAMLASLTTRQHHVATFAQIYSRVHDKILYPLMATDQRTATTADVRGAPTTLDRHITSTIGAAGLGRAA